MAHLETTRTSRVAPRASALATIAVAAIALVGCGDDSAGAGGGEPAVEAVSADELCGRLYGAFRAAHDRCCAETIMPDVDFEQLAGRCGFELQALVDDERLTIDAEVARACLDAFETQTAEASCDTDPYSLYRPVFPEACNGAIVGSVEEKGPCTSHVECVGNLNCVGEAGAIAGNCLPPGVRGEACEATPPLNLNVVLPLPALGHVVCEGDARCDLAYDDFGNLAAVCWERVATGGECRSDAACAEDEICSSDDGVISVCTPLGEDGGACPCAPGFFCACIVAECTDYGDPAQVACRPKRAAGESCVDNSDACLGSCDGSVCTDYCGSG
jgi:hypothetical protein